MIGFETIYVDLFTEDEISKILDKYKEMSVVKIDGIKYFKQNSISKDFSIIFIMKNIKQHILSILDTFHEYNIDNNKVSEISKLSISIYENSNELIIIDKYLTIFKKLDPPTKNRNIEKILFSISQDELNKSISHYNLTYLDYLDKSNINKSNFSNMVNLNDLSKIPNSRGIYFIYNGNEELMYIGKSIHIRDRMKQHLNRYSECYDWKHNFEKVKYIELLDSDDKELDDYETYLINEYKPPLNIAKTYTYKTQRFNLKYNKEVKNFYSLEHYLKFLEAKKYVNEKFDILQILENEENRILKIRDYLEV